MRWNGLRAAERSFATGLDLKTPIRRSQSDDRAEFIIVAMGEKVWIKLENKEKGREWVSPWRVVERMSRMTREALSWDTSQYIRI